MCFHIYIASLCADEKGIDSEENIEVRILHDGTFRIHCNKEIRVRDLVRSPIAQDVKMVLRIGSSYDMPRGSLTADGESAHRTIRPQRLGAPSLQN